MKILVVDDEMLLVKGIRFNLQNEGYEVITGSNGVEALEKAITPSVEKLQKHAVQSVRQRVRNLRDIVDLGNIHAFRQAIENTLATSNI